MDRIHPVFNNTSGRVWRLRSVPSSDPRWRCQPRRRAKSKSPRGDIQLLKSSGTERYIYRQYNQYTPYIYIYIYTQGLTFWCCHSWLEPMYLCMLSKDQRNTQCRITTSNLILCWWVAAVSHACFFFLLCWWPIFLSWWMKMFIFTFTYISIVSFSQAEILWTSC